jgi:hypothetical protein
VTNVSKGMRQYNILVDIPVRYVIPMFTMYNSSLLVSAVYELNMKFLFEQRPAVEGAEAESDER